MEETPEIYPALVDEPPPDSDHPEGDSTDAEEDEEQEAFKARVNRILEMLAEDPEIRDRMMAEMYVTIAEFHAGFKEMQAGVAQMGPGAFLKTMFGRKPKGEDGS